MYVCICVCCAFCLHCMLCMQYRTLTETNVFSIDSETYSTSALVVLERQSTDNTTQAIISVATFTISDFFGGIDDALYNTGRMVTIVTIGTFVLTFIFSLYWFSFQYTRRAKKAGCCGGLERVTVVINLTIARQKKIALLFMGVVILLVLYLDFQWRAQNKIERNRLEVLLCLHFCVCVCVCVFEMCAYVWWCVCCCVFVGNCFFVWQW